MYGQTQKVIQSSGPQSNINLNYMDSSITGGVHNNIPQNINSSNIAWDKQHPHHQQIQQQQGGVGQWNTANYPGRQQNYYNNGYIYPHDHII